MTDPAAEAFLRAFRAASADGRAMDVIASDADGFAAALEASPDAVRQALDEAGGFSGGSAMVPGTAFATAACRADGRILVSDEAFAALDLPPRALSQASRTALGEAPRLSSIIDDRRGHPVAVVIARADRALTWPLSPTVRAALATGVADFAVMGVATTDGVDWSMLLSAWTFSRAETRLAAALVRTGDLRVAAADAGVSYETARETLASSMAKTGARRQPEFVRQLAQLAFGELPENDAVWRTLADAYDLTPRQGRLALLIALGATRATAADALGVSDQTAKADLKVIFERCGVQSGAALGRIVAETDALARLASATDVALLSRSDAPMPLRFVRRRRAPGRIAVEDHGERDGRPVVILHTPINGRQVPRGLVAALRARGLRPISVERPGFGLTTGSPGDVVEEACADLVDVLDTLGLKRVRLLGRSVIMPLSFAARHPDRVESGVLMAASPPGTRPRGGLISTVIDLALDHPNLVEGFARLMVRSSSEQAIMRLSERSMAASPADLSALARPDNRADWIKACRQSSSGDGFAREFVLHADGGVVPVGAEATPWTVLIGAQDMLGAGIGDGLDLWRRAMPSARLTLVADGGRLLHISHPDVVAEALAPRGPA